LWWVLAGLAAAGLAQASVGLWQFTFTQTGPDSFVVLGNRFRAYGTFEQPNPYGGFLGLLWPLPAGLLLHRLRRRLEAAHRAYWLAGCGLAAGLFLLGLVLSFSRGAWLGAAAAALAMAVFLPRRPWLGLSLAGLAIVVAAGAAEAGWVPTAVSARLEGLEEFAAPRDVRGVPINDENYAVIQRLAFWQAAQAMADANPWLGVGLGNYAAAYPHYALLNWPLPIGHAHNVYLNMLAETGVLGLGAYLALWVVAAALTVAALRRNAGWRRGLALGLLGAWAHLAVHHLVDFLYVNNVHLVLGAYLGLAAYLGLCPVESASGQPRQVEGAQLDLSGATA
jgi:O-antigen ligase